MSRERSIIPAGARMLTAARAPRTAGATKVSHFSRQGGILRREKKTTGMIRGARLTSATPRIMSQVSAAFIKDNPQCGAGKGSGDDIGVIVHGGGDKAPRQKGDHRPGDAGI